MAKKQTGRRQAGGDSESAAADSGENLDQVRELLFGGNLRLFESRVTDLEKRMQRELAELTDATDARFAGLEDHVASEVSGLTQRLDTIRKEQTDALKAVEKELKATSRRLDQRLLKLQEQADEIMAVLQERTDDLQARKTDAAALAALFSEIAERISNLGPADDR
jgi:chromosome segregation ATPase